MPSVSPAGKAGINQLFGVAADAAGRAWAVAGYCKAGAGCCTLAERWNGSTKRVAIPTRGTPPAGGFYAVAFTSASWAWATGSYTKAPNIYRTLTEHWNGTTWSHVPSPS